MVKRKIYTVDQVAKMLGISRNGMYRAIERGEIPSVRIGKRIVVPKHVVHKMLGEPPDGEPRDIIDLPGWEAGNGETT